jgi:hypothetical protein
MAFLQASLISTPYFFQGWIEMPVAIVTSSFQKPLLFSVMNLQCAMQLHLHSSARKSAPNIHKDIPSYKAAPVSHTMQDYL